MRRNPARAVFVVTALAVALPPSFAQPKQAPVTQEAVTDFNIEQLDALMAPFAVYPDELLTQVLMASTYPS
jgi:hypothetical protein